MPAPEKLAKRLGSKPKSTRSNTDRKHDGASGGARANASAPRDLSTEILPSDHFTENDVKELENLGFTREQVFAELRRFQGDKTQAMAALFAKSLKF